MRALPAKLLGAVSDATIGTAIVMFHVLLAEREREHASWRPPAGTDRPDRRRRED